MFTLNCKGRLLVIDKPLVMGIINVTPDSFYSGSRQESVEEALIQAENMLLDGASILDIGGQSTRPGADVAGWETELARVLPIIKAIRKKFPASFLSIDSYYSKVAMEAVQEGADMVNDISGGSFDSEMIQTVAKLRTPYICMHVNGTAETMHQQVSYPDIGQSILAYFKEKIADCQDAGIQDMVVDPGFGFSKNIADNFSIINKLEIFKILGKPLLIGVSRKSSIYKTLGISAAEALNGTTVLNTIALMKGASILRVHDVKEAVEAIKLTREVLQ